MTRLQVHSVAYLLLCLLVLMASGSALAKYNASDCASIENIIPPILEIPEGNELQQVLFATGVQIYLYNGTAWNLHNVSADLYNFKANKVGFHFVLEDKDTLGGKATWETFHPHSRVTGKAVASVEVERDSINWLLVQATSNSGKRSLGKSTYVQRLYTQHGLPPSADYRANEGDVFKSHYTSLYIFSKCE